MTDTVYVLNGPNLNLLGMREPEIYGADTLDDVAGRLEDRGRELGLDIEMRQSNHEGQIVDILGKAKKKGFKAVVINPAAYTHTSVAIRDAIAAVDLPTVEVHLSNIYAREEFRQRSLIAPVATGQIGGFGPESYCLGLLAACKMIKK